MWPISILLIVFLSGCAGFDAGVAVGVDKSAEVADKALNSALWYICKGASIGAVRRKFGKAPAPYRFLCENKDLGVIGE